MKSKAELRFVELLRKSPKTQEEIAEKDLMGEIFGQELKYERRDLSQELKDAGARFSDPWDMVNTKEPYPEAIDILVKHLSINYHDKNKEGIIRALTVKEAKGKANKALIEEYNKTPKEKDNLRWIIGNAFTVIITKEDIESILPIVMNKDNGMSRYRFVEALGKIKTEQVKAALTKLLDDEEMAPYAAKALNKFR